MYRYKYWFKKKIESLDGNTILVDETIVTEETTNIEVTENSIVIATVTLGSSNQSVSKEVIKECIPDITFILDLDLETASKRLNLRNENSNEKDSFESEKMEYHQKVRNGFLDLSKKLPERFVILDATKNKEQVFNEAISILKDIYKLWKL